MAGKRKASQEALRGGRGRGRGSRAPGGKSRTARRRPFASNIEYLDACLQYLQLLGMKRGLEHRLNARTAGASKNGWQLFDFDGCDRGDEVGAGLEPPELKRRLKNVNARVARQKRDLELRVELTRGRGEVELYLEELVRLYGLDEFEKYTLLLLLGPHLDDAFRRFLEAVSRCRSNEVRSILDILCGDLLEKIRARRYFAPSSRLLSNKLINLSRFRDLSTEDGFMSMELEISRSASSLILGEEHIDSQLFAFSSLLEPEVDLEQVIIAPQKKDEVLALIRCHETAVEVSRDWGFQRILPYGRGLVIMFSGASGTGKTMFAHGLAKETGRRLLLVDAKTLLNNGRGDFEDNLRRAFIEARMQHAIIFFDEADELFLDRLTSHYLPAVLREFERMEGICILATNRGCRLDEALERRIIYKLDFPLPTPEMRERIWRGHLPPEAPRADDIRLEELARDFEFSGGLIKNAVLIAVNRAARRSGDQRCITHADLFAGACLQRSNQLQRYAEGMAPRVGLADVILPPQTQESVLEVLNAARQRATVFSTWGFGRKFKLGRALSVLFSGESGVGKTMTAEAIAYELGQNLMPVRLPSVLSKYVGETEKRLAAVFADAADRHAVLFFDEADALFNARLEEDTSSAHHINLRVNTLLVELERFNGMVIFASNRPRAFDKAFERRIRYRVEFPRPGREVRERLWRAAIPAAAPVAADVDYRELARDYDFNGGTIRNVVLRAAFMAATDGGVITGEILRACAQSERHMHSARRIGFAHQRPSRVAAGDRERAVGARLEGAR